MFRMVRNPFANNESVTNQQKPHAFQRSVKAQPTVLLRLSVPSFSFLATLFSLFWRQLEGLATTFTFLHLGLARRLHGRWWS
jgi:hypothetical protein